MCAAICWMLQAWLPPIWALVGGLLAAIRLGGFNYSGEQLLGRSRCCDRRGPGSRSYPPNQKALLRAGLANSGLGFVILANSRPYEGLFFSLPVIAVLIKWLFDKRTPASISLWRVVLPLCLIIVMGEHGCFTTSGAPRVIRSQPVFC